MYPLTRFGRLTPIFCGKVLSLVLIMSALSGGCQKEANTSVPTAVPKSPENAREEPAKRQSRDPKTKEAKMELAPPEEKAIEKLWLTIEEQGAQRRDRLCFKAKVRNISNKPFGWDKEFSVLVHWILVADDEKYRLKPVTVVSEIEQSKESLAKTRFVQIKPGATLSKTFVLTQPFRRYAVYASGSTPDGRHPSHFEGYEELVRYSMGPKVKKLRIRLEAYSTWSDSSPAFRALFGFDRSEVNLWALPPSKYTSNEVVLRLNKTDVEVVDPED